MRYLLLILGVTVHCFSAGYNFTDAYINVPIAKQYNINEIQFGASYAYSGAPAIQGESSNRYDMDLKAVYSFSNRHQLAINLVNPTRYVGHYQYTITDEFSPYQLAAGIKNISESPFSTWESDRYVEDVNMSPYIVNTYYNPNTTFTIGYGVRAFEHQKKSLIGIGSFVENLNGVFFGFSFDQEIVSFLVEYDGKDINLGIKFRPSDTYEINLGLTEQFVDGDFNPQHEMAPKRQITFGISSRNLFSQNDHFNSQIKALNLKVADLERRELNRINEQKKKKEPELISDDDVLKTRVAELYSESLISYNNRDYSRSIRMLQDALTLDPKNMLILSRLGSVYYTYGLLDHAAYYWQQAVDINPNSPDLVDVKTFLSNRL
ncbi:MAG: hypothetical protein ISQ13_04500 [Candidatus Margulisbacteria bacterium]|nr:hypothetical protein [Candidatus Margulisiibacteriota bacterium]